MSTKIYNGYYIEKCSLDELHNRMMEFNLKFKECLDKEYYSLIGCLIADTVDRSSFGLKIDYYLKEICENGKVDHLLFKLISLTWEKYKKIKTSEIRDDTFDFSMTAVLIPRKDKILALLYTQRNAFIELWTNQPYIHKYKYWNNTDKPESIDDKEWDSRRDEWNSVFDELSITPSLCGFTWEMFAEKFPIPKNELILKYIPNDEARALNIAKLIDEKEYLKKRYGEESRKLTKEEQETFISEYTNWLQSDERKSRINEIKKQIIEKLPIINEQTLSSTVNIES